MLGYWFQPALQIVLVANLAWSGIDGISMALTKLQLVQLAVNFSIVVLLGRPWEPDQSVTAIDSRCPYHGQSSLGMAWNILWVWNRPSMIVKTKICTWLQDVTSIKKKTALCVRTNSHSMMLCIHTHPKKKHLSNKATLWVQIEWHPSGSSTCYVANVKQVLCHEVATKT